MVTLNGENFLTRQETAERMGVHPNSIYDMIQRGSIPAPRKIGKRKFWHERDLYEFFVNAEKETQ
jgi:excisionase family DNA binding protein